MEPAGAPTRLLLQAGSETILVVEDEAALRRMIQRALERFGYRVVLARSAPEALALWRDHAADVDLLLTDLVMPGGLSGWDLAEHLRRDRPELPILVMSGYDPEERVRGADLDQADGSVPFLPKPYDVAELIAAVRACLDGARPG
ncbi:MAG TPA: response regulator [Longimicrobiales bacterium]|nr:response regulator [Longimicrobiales bacterium]